MSKRVRADDADRRGSSKRIKKDEDEEEEEALKKGGGGGGGVMPMLIPREFHPESDPEEIASAFERDGFVVIHAFTREQCRWHIERQIRDIWLQQPWRDGLRLFKKRTRTRTRMENRQEEEGEEKEEEEEELDIDRDTREYIDAFTRPGLSDAELQHLKDVAPFHAGFGACCDPKSFHSPQQWELRQDPRLYAIASRIIGRKDIWVDINRSIQKLPTKGEDEFLHWDLAYLHTPWSKPDAIGGKVAWTDTEFVCVPGTNTEDMHRRIVEAYRPLYPNAKPTDAKFALDPRKPDPLELRRRRVAVKVFAGRVIFWSKWACHGVRPNARDAGIQLGDYLGYMPAEDRKAYAKRAGIGELEDRIQSFRLGRAPVLWPSLDRIFYFPARYLNFTRMLQPFIDKVRPGWPGLTTRTIKSGPRKGEVIPHLEPVLDPNYQAPALTPLGQRLLGLCRWE